MDQKHRNQITRNVNLLIKPGILSYEKIRELVLQRNIFTLRMIEDIDDEKTNTEKLRKLLLDLCTRGPSAFHKFIGILKQTNHTAAIEILLPDGEHFNIEENNNTVEERSEVDNYAHHPDTLKVIQVPAVGGSIKEQEASVITRVKLAEQWTEGEGIYKMSSAPRGLCFILNNVNFTKREERKGSEKNAKYLEVVFNDLGFSVEPHQDKTAEEIKNLLGTFASRKEHAELDCCVVILMSHGSKNAIEGIHSNLVYLKNVYELFNNENCPSLIHKPKLFFINACRGDQVDYGAPIPPYREVTTDGVPYLRKPAEELRVPVWTDILICYSTVEGYAAVRDPEYGSWFIHYLVLVLMERAWNTDLNTMLQEVQRELLKCVGKYGERQSAEIVNLVFHKKLYFNPGLYKYQNTC